MGVGVCVRAGVQSGGCVCICVSNQVVSEEWRDYF